MTRLALIADDLTGAADSGVQFAKRGLSTILLVDRGPYSDTEVVIINTESRADPKEIAYAKAYTAASALPRVEFIYKKIDSTLRGHIGIELEAILDARHLARAVVAPAFPLTGRTTVRGQQLLNGQPLENTAFAQDPLYPMTHSHIPTLLGHQIHRKVGLIELPLVREGVETLTQIIQDREEAILIVDATTAEDLRTIAHAALQVNASCLTCGSAGLADAIAEAIWGGQALSTTPEPPPTTATGAPVLVVAASRNPLTTLQLSRAAQEMALKLLAVDTERLATDARAVVAELVAEAGQHLSTGYSVALSAVDSPYSAGLNRALVQALGQATARLTAQHSLAGLVLTGGDTALAVCQALGTRALSLTGEVAPGMPCARLHDGPHAGLPLVTKAGGFGREEAIVVAIRYLQGTV